MNVVPSHRLTFSSEAGRRLWNAGVKPRPAWRAPTYSIFDRPVPPLPKWTKPGPQAIAVGNFPPIRTVQDAACLHFGISRADLLSHRRTKALARPRQVAMYLSQTLTLSSLSDVGRCFGGRDHSTVYHAKLTIEALIAAGDPIAADVEAIRSKIPVPA